MPAAASAVEQLPGGPHERPADDVLAVARRFAYDHDLGIGGTFAEHRLSRVTVKTATAAGLAMPALQLVMKSGMQLGLLPMISKTKDSFLSWVLSIIPIPIFSILMAEEEAVAQEVLISEVRNVAAMEVMVSACPNQPALTIVMHGAKRSR